MPSSGPQLGHGMVSPNRGVSSPSHGMAHPSEVGSCTRVCFGPVPGPRKKLIKFIVFLCLVGVNAVFIAMATTSSNNRESSLEEELVGIQTELEFLESQYKQKQENLIQLQDKLTKLTETTSDTTNNATLSSEAQDLLNNVSGYEAVTGPDEIELQLKPAFALQLLPHLMRNPHSLKPAYLRRSPRTTADVVIGVPTVKRLNETYIYSTVGELIQGLTPEHYNSTLIVVMVGETELDFVENTVVQLEFLFPKDVKNGLIEVIAPSAAYYPDFDTIADTLGDPHKRVKWRTKQNLDVIYLMAYAQTRGTLYLMLEDDVITTKNYMQDIKSFTTRTTRDVPNWFFIEFSGLGAIGKLFKSSSVNHFLIYVQLFYNNMPIDWLLESYLADKVCTISKSTKQCGDAKDLIRPKYTVSLFQHIGYYSTLDGKIQTLKDPKFVSTQNYFPHSNPPLRTIKTDIIEYENYTFKRAYQGETYFWGVSPKSGDTLEFCFEKPTKIKRYTFRSGNAQHSLDRFYDTTVEARVHNGSDAYVNVGSFNRLGVAEGDFNLGPLTSMRLRVNSNSSNWVVLSEIHLEASGTLSAMEEIM